MLRFRSDATRAKLAALDAAQAVIEFAPDGTILTANANFLTAMGYGLDEIRGRHHGLFVDPGERDGSEYYAFWDRLRAGVAQAQSFKRLAKGGREVWIEASYNPIRDRAGRVVKVVKFATDITEKTWRSLDLEGQIAALHRSQAVIQAAEGVDRGLPHRGFGRLVAAGPEGEAQAGGGKDGGSFHGRGRSWFPIEPAGS